MWSIFTCRTTHLLKWTSNPWIAVISSNWLVFWSILIKITARFLNIGVLKKIWKYWYFTHILIPIEHRAFGTIGINHLTNTATKMTGLSPSAAKDMTRKHRSNSARPWLWRCLVLDFLASKNKKDKLLFFIISHFYVCYSIQNRQVQ